MHSRSSGGWRVGRIAMATWLGAMGVAGLARPLSGAEAGALQRSALILDLDGVVGPASASYITRGLQRAAQQGAVVVVLRIDTPGGLDTSMREIIRAITTAPLPVIGYVSPSGSRAASAGTYILYACHVAAMAPGTNVGAATPVRMGGAGGAPGLGDGAEQPAPATAKPESAPPNAAAQPASAEERKVLNDAVAYIRSLAELRGRNADWAEAAVRQSVSLPARAALEQHVIDLIAPGVDELLAQVDGRKVALAAGEVVLHTRGLPTATLQPDWRTQLLGIIANPNIALLLLAIGAYGLLFEFFNPGAVFPGTIGGIALIVGLYAVNLLPINYAGLALILLGMGLMVAEAFAPSFGVLGIGGIAALVLGAGILIDTDAPGFQIAWPVIAGLAAASALLLLFVVPIGIRALRRKAVTGREEMLGSHGRVELWDGTRGTVLIHSERWRATCEQPLSPGRSVRVVGMDGLTLQVAPLELTESSRGVVA
jgi:membrane-bound serine protease (ClpP class)